MIKTLIVEPDLAIAHELKGMIESMGIQVFHALSFERAKELALKNLPHFIISEIDLPDSDGLILCQEIKKLAVFSGIPFIISTSKNDAYIQIMGYESGVDDFVFKPFNKRLVSAKLKSLLRRLNMGMKHGASKNELVINREKFIIEYKGKDLILPRKEFEILCLLYYNKGIVFNRDKIKHEVWKEKSALVNSRTIDVHIKNIRELIGDKFIKTIKGVGYKFEN